MLNISNKLKELRLSNGYSQEELAEKLTVTRQAVSKWERGEALPDTENLVALALLYKMSLDELVGYSADTEEESEFTTNEVSEGGEEIEEEQKEPTSVWVRVISEFSYTILVTVVFLLLGFIWNLWHVAWILFVTIPLYDSIVDCIKTKLVSEFNYPVFVTAIYLFLGMQFGLWHPAWVIFITIPIFYSIADAIDRK